MIRASFKLLQKWKSQMPAVDTSRHEGMQSLAHMQKSATDCDCGCCKLIMIGIKLELPHTKALRRPNAIVDALKLRRLIIDNDDGRPGERALAFGQRNSADDAGPFHYGVHLSVVLVHGTF